MDKKKIIFLGAIGILFIVLVFITISNFNNSDGNIQSDSFKVPDVVAENSKDFYASKLAKANQNRNPQNDENINPNAEFKTYARDSSLNDTTIITVNPELNSETEYKEPVKPKPKTSSSNQPRKVKKNQTPVNQVQTKTAETVIDNTPKSGFGIVRNENVKSTPVIEAVPLKTNDFFPIINETTVTIRNNTNIVFILLEDLIVGSETFKKNAIAFGKAKQYDHFFDVHIYQIKNTDGLMYNVEKLNIFVFDENYSRGFKFEGKVDEGVKEGTMETVSGTSITEMGVKTGAKLVDRVVNKVARKKEPTVSILRGYRIYIKTIN